MLITALHRRPKHIIFDGLVAWWPMNEGTGTTSTADASGNDHTGTFVNVDEGDWTTGPVGLNAINLDGSSEIIETGSWHVSTGDLTACIWVNLDTLPTSGDNEWNLIGRFDTGANKRAWIVNTREVASGAVLFTGIVADAGIFSTETTSVVYSQEYDVDFSQLNTGQWYHVCLRYKESTGVVDLFQDGVDKSATYARRSDASSIYDATGVEVSMGANYTSGTAQRWVDGSLADGRVYNRWLTDDEIAAIAAGRG